MVVVGGWSSAEVAVAQPVAVAFECDDFGVVDEPVGPRVEPDALQYGGAWRVKDGVPGWSDAW